VTIIALICLIFAIAFMASEVYHERDWPRHSFKFFAWFFAIFLFCASAFGQGARYDSHVWNASKNVPPGATAPIYTQPYAKITVCGNVPTPASGAVCTNQVSLFSDAGLTVPISQPLIADSLGQFGFYATPGNYSYSIQNQAGQYLATLIFGINGVAGQMNVEAFPGSDLGAKINAADAALGSAVGTLTVNSTATATTAYTLSSGHDLQINANVTLSALGTLNGKNKISCNGGSVVTVTSGNAFASSADNIQIQNCTATGDGGNGASLLTTSGSSHMKLSYFRGTGIGIVHANGGSDLQVSHISTTDGVYGVVFQGTSFVNVDDVACDGTDNCVEWFNHDANPAVGGPTSRATVLSLGAGHYVINNVRCNNVVACAWGSVGYDAVISNSLADTCSDVCFDAEGSMDVSFNGTTATGGNNADGAVFFYSDNNSFNNSHYSGTTILIRVFNSSLNPGQSTNMKIVGGTLDCGTTAICTGFGGDAWDGLVISGVEFRNAVMSNSTQGGGSIVKNNHLVYSISNPTAFNAISITNRIQGSVTAVENNRIEVTAAQPAGSSAIFLETAFFNATQAFQIRNNYTSGFPIDINTANDGTNPSVGMVTILDGNWVGANNVIHTHPNGNLDSYVELSRVSGSGINWLRSVFTGTNIPHMSGATVLASSATIAPVSKLNFITGTTQTTTITPPPGIIAGECMTFVSGSTWSVATGGNLIMPTSPISFTANQSLQICYDNDITHNFYVNH
jgi:hypothetical protein